MHVDEKGTVVAKEEKIVFEKGDLRRESRKVEIWQENRKESVVLPASNFDFSIEDSREIYHRRRAVETLRRQLKQNFPPHFFHGDSVNAIQIQTRAVPIAGLPCTVIARKLKRHCPFSQIVTVVRQTPVYYMDFVAFMENPDRGRQIISGEYANSPRKSSGLPSILSGGLTFSKTNPKCHFIGMSDRCFGLF